VTITAEHSSGLHSVEPADLKAALVKQLADEPDFLSLTEMMSEARAAVLDDFPAYAVARVRGTDGEDECAALLRRATLPAFTFDVELLSELPIPRRSGKLCAALVVKVADSAIGPAHTRIIIHLPSGVEDDLRDGDADGAQARVYRDAIGGLRRLVASIDGPVVITGDWNLDLRKQWVRDFLKRHFPEFTPTWRAGNLPELGTHGSRVIDFSLVRGFSVTAAHVVPDFGASDHRAIRETHKEIPVMPTVIDQLRAAGVECYSRTEWGSPRERDGSYARRRVTHPMPPGPADFHFLHITVTDDTDLPADGKDAARKVESFGLSTPPMVSYQDLVTNEGRYFQGQDYGTKGTHTVNDKKVPGFPLDLNLHGYAVAIMQNVGDQVTDEQVDVVAMVFAARELAGLVKRGAPIYPHRKFANKSCPGDRAVARLDEIEALRDKYVREGLPSAGAQEDEVTPEDIDKIATAAVEKLLATRITTETGEWTVKQLLRGTYNNVVGE